MSFKSNIRSDASLQNHVSDDMSRSRYEPISMCFSHKFRIVCNLQCDLIVCHKQHSRPRRNNTHLIPKRLFPRHFTESVTYSALVLDPATIVCFLLCHDETTPTRSAVATNKTTIKRISCPISSKIISQTKRRK